MSAHVSRSIRLIFISELTGVLVAIWVTRQVATIYAATLAAYLVLRQMLNWFVGVGFWGLNVSLPRALAADDRPEARRRLMAAGLLIISPMLLILALVSLFAPRTASLLLLHDASAAQILAAASFLFGCYGLFGIASSALQGIDRFGLLAIGRIFAYGVGPVAIVASLAHRAALPTVLWAWGATVLIVDLALAVPLWWAVRLPRAAVTGSERLWLTCRRLVTYGGRRMLGSLSQFSVLATAPSLALWAGASVGAAGALSSAALFGLGFAPVCLALRQVALTRLSQQLPVEAAGRLAQDFFAATACAGAAFIGVLAASGDRIIGVWLGGQFRDYDTLVRLSVVAVGLQYFCSTLEGVLDAADPAHQRPNTQHLAALLFFICAGVALARHAGAAGLVAAQLVSTVAQSLLYTRLIALRYALPSLRELGQGALSVGVGGFLVGLPLRLGRHDLHGTVLLCGGQMLAVLALLWVAWASGVRWPSLVLGDRGRRAERIWS